MVDKLISLSDAGSIASIIGLIITVFILNEAKKIRQTFLNKARIPEVSRSLSTITSKLPDNIKEWNTDKSNTISDLNRCKSILINLKPRISKDFQKSIGQVINKLDGKNSLFNRGKKIIELNEDELWEIYGDMQSILEWLKQNEKDLRWES